ncbi:MAG: class I SAM-dependent methyltransferase [Anaerolineales bacterium]|nr:class I SAM-dependent methyltransferase [Anaerolineales bacterium]
MTRRDRLKWDGRYAAEGQHWQKSPPRKLLLAYLDQLPITGLALDAAAGVGVNGLVLARRGLHVVALDISEVGLRLAQQRALAEDLTLETAVYDLAHPWFPPHCFDVVLNFRFLERSTFPMYRRALKPGGWLIFETFIRAPETAADVDFYLLPGELHAAFADWDVVYSEENTTVGGRSRQLKPVAGLVARKPKDGD